MLQKISSVIINRFGLLEQKIINQLLKRKKTINHNGYQFTFYTPNALNRYRVKTFASKEPETLAWIDSFKKSSTFWDIGANIGLYSIYAAKTKNAQVFAFEPSVFNLELLAKNISTNQLQEKISLFPLALSDKKGFNLFKMNNPAWGSALSSFGVDFDQHGKDFKTTFSYTIPGISSDKALELFSLAKPNYIKIDVDGIEHIILSGATNILQTVHSVLIEINDDFVEQAQKSKQYLSAAGLTLKQKFMLNTNSFQNQLWIRNTVNE